MFIYTMEKWTPLHTAAQSGDVDKVRELLEGGKYDVNCVDWDERTPLHFKADGDTPLLRATWMWSG